MARPLRIQKAGGWYHVSSRGNERKPIYRDDRDREHFLDLVVDMVSRFRVRLQEQRGARRLMAERPAFAAVVERSKGADGLNFGTSMGTLEGT